MMENQRLFLIDGSGYIFRAFHALPPMNRKDGTPVNAVFGFTSMILKLIDDATPDYAIVVFDLGRITFRNEIFPEYKANRDAAPEELIPQFPIIRDATRALNLPMAEVKGFEADDLIATYARDATAKGMQVVIVSSDKDLMQLIRPGVTMLDPMKQKHIDRAEVIERFSVPPEKVIDVQALAGDSTDNVPGVPGIGIKTAAELINTYDNLENLLACAHEIKQPKRRENLLEHADMARVSMQLVTLRDDVPLPVKVEDAALQAPQDETLRAFLEEQNFQRLINKLDSGTLHSTSSGGDGKTERPKKPAAKVASDYVLINDIADLKQWVEMATQAGVVAIDTETTSLTASQALLVGISMAVAPGKACYIPLRHHGNPAQGVPAQGSPEQGTPAQEVPVQRAPVQGGLDFGDGNGGGGADDNGNGGSGAGGNGNGGGGASGNDNDGDDEIIPQLPLDEVVSCLAPLLADASVLKVGHNFKYDYHILARGVNGGFSVAAIDDTMCLSYVLDAGRQQSHKLDDLVALHLDHDMIKYEDVCGKGAKQIGFAQIKPEDALTYAAEDADYTLRLWSVLKPRLASEGKARVYERLERPLIGIIAAMEAEGIKVDKGVLATMSQYFAGRIKEIEKRVHTLADEEFNVGSPAQLGEILFDKMGLTGGKKSKTGAWSTSVDVLEGFVAEGVEIAEQVLEWRHMSKLKSTYADALIASSHPDTGRVHTSFSMSGASTGRLSSSDPNLQNIPVRTPEGREIRKAFVPEEGAVLISADYSQIELRLVADIANETAMMEAFRNNIDIHAQTASEVFSIPLAEMTPETRRRAKAINFGIIYGISGFGLARQLGISRAEAGDYIDAYFQRFPGIRGYMDDMKAKAREDGFVETLFGRRIYITGIKSSNPAQRGFAERQAINAPIQGTAADIIKQAMVRMPEALAQAQSSARMLLQVHDELIFECPHDAAADTVAIVGAIMEQSATPQLNLSVPLVVEANIGASWDEAH